MNVTQQELDMLCQIAKQAGEMINTIYQQQIDVWLKKDNSPLTQADLEADRIICQGLESYFPGVMILSEESQTAIPSKTPKLMFLVDPLDGTKEFLEHNDEFTVNIALVHQSKVVAGVVFAPALNELFYAAQGVGCWKEDVKGKQPLNMTQRDETQPLRIIASRSHGSDQLDDWLNNLNQPYTLMTAGSSLKFCRLADGQADIYPRFGPTSQWDTAAAQCIVEQAGGKVTDLAGESLTYGLERSILNPFFIASSSTAIHNYACPFK